MVNLLSHPLDPSHIHIRTRHNKSNRRRRERRIQKKERTEKGPQYKKKLCRKLVQVFCRSLLTQKHCVFMYILCTPSIQGDSVLHYPFFHFILCVLIRHFCLSLSILCEMNIPCCWGLLLLYIINLLSVFTCLAFPIYVCTFSRYERKERSSGYMNTTSYYVLKLTAHTCCSFASISILYISTLYCVCVCVYYGGRNSSIHCLSARD